MTHPLHPFHTGKDETDAVVVRPKTVKSQQVCSQCGNLLQHSHAGFQCEPCDFKLCSHCDKTEGYAHPSHISHFLFLVNLTHQIWTCNACNKSCSEIKDTTCYICETCKFYLCRSCFEPKKFLLHEHELTKMDVRCIYYGTLGHWMCDSCGGNNGPRNYFPRHCNKCTFSVCDKCCQPHRSTLHLHELYKANTMLVYERFFGGWRCDICSRVFRPQTNKFPYHCQICEFDLCDSCMDVSDSKAHPPSAYSGYSRTAIATTAAGFPVTSPEEDLVDTNNAPPVADDAKCLICVTKPKDATIIHGSTGHVCCCIDCARELERRTNCCPICREPIELVIQNILA